MEDEYGVERRRPRYDTAYRSKLQRKPTIYIALEEELIGLYRFACAYALYIKPEHIHNATRFYPVGGAPMAIATGRVYLENGVKLAMEIITTHKGHSKVCWTVPSCLEYVATEEP
jgi:hypothetical protein